MATQIVVPQLGESITEATVATWLKAVGDAVAVDEPIVALDTDKTSVEIPSPVAGVLQEIAVEEGTDVEVGALLGVIAEGAATGTAAKPAAPAPKPEPAPSPAQATPAPAAAPAPAPAPTATPAQALALSPAVRKLVEENNLDPSAIPASGKDGRLTKGDVVAYLESSAAHPSPASATPVSAPTAAPAAPVAAPAPAVEQGALEERVKMTRLRKRIAERLKEAQNTAAMLTTFNECDMTAVMAARNAVKDAFEKKHGVRLGFMSFFTKACIVALKEFPAVNASIEGDDLVYKNHYDIGVAVGTPNGLVVPVIKDADAMSFAAIEAKIGDLGKRARDGKLSMDELQGGTFTITNGGIFGSLMSTPILNPPQSGILGMHKIQQRAMVMPDGSIQARPMMYLALSYDHRIIDGREAVSFLVRVKECIEDPQRILLEV